MRSWRPHVIIDVHNYPSKRKHLLARNLTLLHDIFIDIPTNPSVTHDVDEAKLNDFFENVQLDLELQGYSCGRYTIVKPSGRVRHSTPDVKDARNSLSLRYNILAILLEGRNPTRDEGNDGRKRVVSAQYCVLVAIIKWIKSHPMYFTENQKYVIPSLENKIAIRSKYERADKPLQMAFRNVTT